METLRRALLFVPGGNEKLLAKGLGLDVDSLILDLEDSVAPERKALAREAVVEALKTADFTGKERVVRVNSISTEYGRSDITEVTKGRPDTFLVPKINWPKEILDYDSVLREAEKREAQLHPRLCPDAGADHGGAESESHFLLR